ncbi:MAG: fatty acid desaturase [Bacteriovoracaceae bacterium]
MIFGVIVICIFASHWSLWFFPFSFAIISGLQVALSILLHDGAHHNMHKNKWWNEVLTDFFCSVPLTTFTKYYRALHLTHHRYTSSEIDDPERPLFRYLGFNYAKMSKKEFFIMLVKDLFGVTVIKYSIWMNKFIFGLQKNGKLEKLTLREIFVFVLFWTTWIFLFWKMHMLLLSLVLWFVPLVTTTITLIKLHAHGEHFFPESDNEFERTYTHDFNIVTQFFIYPLNSDLHLEHHLYPTVPWYNLKKLQNRLMKDPEYKVGADKVTVDGYFFGTKTIFKDLTY